MTNDLLLARDCFSNVVNQCNGKWANETPCAEWDARGLVNHVIKTLNDFVISPLENHAGRS